MLKLWCACLALVGVAAIWYAPEALALRDQAGPSAAGAAQRGVAQPGVAQPSQAPQAAPALPQLTAAQIVDKNVTARGGLAAWRVVQSIMFSGKLDAGGKANALLSYTLQLERPNKQRLAIEFAGNTSVQVFDGQKGWKLRPDLNRADPEPFSPDEVEQSAEDPGFEGPLIDHASKGNKVELEGTEMVDGKATYRLKVTNKQGHASHIWIDGTTFLEAKTEGRPRRLDGRMRQVASYPSDYRTVGGVVIPYVSETRVEGVRAARKMTIEQVALNPKLDDTLFVQPVAAALPAQRVFTMSRTSSGTNPQAAAGAQPPQSK